MPRRVPTTNWSEFVSQWEPTIKGIIVSKGIFYPDLEDCLQCIYEKIIENDGLVKYDPLKGGWTTYIYAVVLSEVGNYRTRQIRHNSRYYPASSLSRDEREFFSEFEDDEATTPTDDTFHQEIQTQIERLRQALDDIYPTRSAVDVQTDHGLERRVRSHLEVFDLFFFWDMSQKEIGEHLAYSPQSVNLLLHQIRDVPEARKLLQMWRGL